MLSIMVIIKCKKNFCLLKIQYIEIKKNIKSKKDWKFKGKNKIDLKRKSIMSKTKNFNLGFKKI